MDLVELTRSLSCREDIYGLIHVDGKLPNLALRKIYAYITSHGSRAEFVREGKEYRKIFAAAIFSESKQICENLWQYYGDRIEIGGTGWDLKKKLPTEIEQMRPARDLYTVEMIAPRIKGRMSRETRIKKAQTIVSAAMGFTSRGCVRNCAFCVVPKKEGCFQQAAEIGDLLYPDSKVLILNDNNLTADPYVLNKLQEIRERQLVVDINQGIDIRLINDDTAYALSHVRHLRSLHYAWDLMPFEQEVLRGIKVLAKYVPLYKHMCFVLVGFNTSFEEDIYRIEKLNEVGVTPYVMIYNQKNDRRLRHFARWVNAKIMKVCSFEEYTPWINERKKEIMQPISLFDFKGTAC